MITESNLRTAYHFTYMSSLILMLKDNRIDLSMAYSKGSEERYAEGKYPFFLSTTQYKNPKIGYQSSFAGYVARLELNMAYLASQGKFKRVMFFNRKDQENETGKANFWYQSEDRLLSTKNSIPFDKAVLRVDLFSNNGLIPKDVIKGLNKLNIPYSYIGTESEHEYDVYDDDEGIVMDNALAALRAIKNKYGDVEFNNALSRAKEFSDAKYYEPKEKMYISEIRLNNPLMKAILRPYIIKYMREGKEASDLVYDLNSAIRK